MSENLVIYYSRRGQNYVNGNIVNLKKGNAEYITDFIVNAVGADTFHVETVKPYSEDYMECTREATKDIQNHAKPELKEYLKDISAYKNIFIVGPCWWGTYPMALFHALDGLDFTGKNVFPVMTHEGSGMGHCERDLKKKLTGAKFGSGLAVHGADAPQSEARVATWAKKAVNE